MIALRKNPLQKEKGMNGVLLSFLFGALGAFIILLSFVIVDKGFLIYTGDYNLQQIPFYSYVQHFIKTGGGTWSWATDLGSSLVTTYSFYNLGSPFLWLTLLFPNSWMPFLMAPLFVLKFGCIAAAAFLFLSRYAKTKEMAVVCSVIYAFCGFNVYNIFFNHMLDPVVFFPLLLWAMDGFFYEKKRGYFAVFTGLALLNSYFFFVGNVVFVVIYFVVKVLMGEYRLQLKEFGLFCLEAVVGVGIGMALALPSLLALMGNPRTDNFASGFNLVMYWNVQQYFNIFTSAFLPPDPPWMPNLFTEGAIKHTSMSAFLPIVSVAGVAAYCKAHKKSWVKTLLLISAICAFVPILNSAFYAFNASYYARWYYMPVLVMVLATMHALEEEPKYLRYGVKVALGITLGYIIFTILPTQKDGERILGVAQDTTRFWVTLLTALLGIGIFYVLVFYYRNKPHFSKRLLAAVLAFSVFFSIVHLATGRIQQWQNDKDYRDYTYEAAAEIDLPDDSFYRLDTFGTYANMGLWLDKSVLQTFNSTVNTSIMEFYPSVGVKRDVSSEPEASEYALRGLLSVRYTMVPLAEFMVPVEEIPASRYVLGIGEETYVVPFTDIPEGVGFEASSLKLEWVPEIGYGNTGSLGWRFYKAEGGYAIFENDNYVPLGFTYDAYISLDHLQLANEGDRAGLLMRGVGLSAEQIVDYGYLFREEVGEEQMTDALPFVYDAITYTQYVEDCNARRASSSYDIQADASGFTSKIYLDKENLVFFAVPYDEGFTATVNGVETEVLKVSNGLMAVYAPAGDNEIVFLYKTPGFSAGLILSLVSLLLLCAYLFLCRVAAKKQPATEEMHFVPDANGADEEADDGQGTAADGFIETGETGGKAPPLEGGSEEADGETAEATGKKN